MTDFTTPGLAIHGLGVATPAASVSQAALAASTRGRCGTTPAEHRKIDRIFAHAGVGERSSVLSGPGDAAGFPAAFPPATSGTDGGPTIAERMRWYEAHALPLTVRAAEAAMRQAAIDAGDVGQLIVVSCTGFYSPGVDVGLIEALGLPPSVGRSLVGFMGCHGAMNGLRVTEALARTQPDRWALMCCVELCSLHFQYGYDPQRIVANALFGDGAAAVAGRAVPAGSDPAGIRLVDQASTVLPDSAGAMTWRIRDHGFEMGLSPRVPELIETHLRSFVGSWLGGRGHGKQDVAHWAVHPGGPAVLDAVERALHLPEGACDASRVVLAEHGNMSSPTLLFILDRLRRSGARGLCAALAFGPGLTVEAALLELG